MFKKFNNKRKHLHYEGKKGKYIKYAIGEILFIVIGILAALQVNNWNLVRKDRIIEIQLLNGIRRDILTDTLDFNDIIKGYQIEIKENTQLLEHILSRKEYDSSFVHLIKSAIGTDSHFLHNKTHFKEAQQKGLAIFSNRELGERITRLYEYDYPFYETAENNSEQFNVYRIMNNNLLIYLEYDNTGLTINSDLYAKLLDNKNLSFQLKRVIELKKILLRHCQLTLTNALNLEKLITNYLEE